MGPFTTIHSAFNALCYKRFSEIRMTLFRNLFAAALGVGLIAAPALAGPRDGGAPPARSAPTPRVPAPHVARDQDRAFQATRDGRSMPLPKIERRVMPFMGGADYLGPEFNGDTYRLKFMRGGRVIWVDVEASTGRIIRQSKP
jgi:hypothetical protein